MKKILLYLPTAVSCMILGTFGIYAQTYVRYVKPEDIGTKVVYADSVLTSIALPRSVSRLSSYPPFNAAVLELSQILDNPDYSLLSVYICGSSSPDGLYANNAALGKARTEEAVAYIKSLMDIPDSKIHAESLDEDWGRLYELVKASDIQYREEVLDIIENKSWGERKTALQKLDDGRVWKRLDEDFFPKLRCVRFAIYCKWDPSKPYLGRPEKERIDTVYLYDTVYVKKQIYVEEVQVQESVEEVAAVQESVDVETGVPAPAGYPVEDMSNVDVKSPAGEKAVKYWDTPWMLGFKTNLLADAVVMPNVGFEVQLADHFSFELMGMYTQKNIFFPDDNTKIYGFRPEVRYWTRRAMHHGHFFGLHANVAWYTLKWDDGKLYQNFGTVPGKAGNDKPAWSVGATYGYMIRLDKKEHWGLEFLLGVGYGQYRQDVGVWSEDDQKWYSRGIEDKQYIGVTRVGINLIYKFSVRRVRQE